MIGMQKMLWAGDPAILPTGALVEILATDQGAALVTSQVACWVRWWPEGADAPSYRSCDAGDLADHVMSDKELAA